ncbi:hypothetical protein [Pseudomonas sp. A-B-26]|uniref:hypothetical protein n=1 Tax=Pseudomonas sp. A-B-26 TaxID=2832406 RepID=UPI001CBAE1B6|nr:hypothetical protein [Pseudomonas sp. A-B-26]
MKNVDARVRKNIASLLAQQDLLRLIVRRPAEYASNEAILDALSSQGTMARLEFEYEDAGQVKIKTPLSLNTVKTYANRILDRGFEGLNDLRISAYERIQSFNERTLKPTKRTKIGLTRRNEELEFKLDHHRRINMVLLQGLSLAMGELKSVRDAPDAKIREKRTIEALRTLAALVSLNPPPFDAIHPSPVDTNVANIESYRK